MLESASISQPSLRLALRELEGRVKDLTIVSGRVGRIADAIAGANPSNTKHDGSKPGRGGFVFEAFDRLADIQMLLSQMEEDLSRTESALGVDNERPQDRISR